MFVLRATAVNTTDDFVYLDRYGKWTRNFQAANLYANKQDVYKDLIIFGFNKATLYSHEVGWAINLNSIEIWKVKVTHELDTQT